MLYVRVHNVSIMHSESLLMSNGLAFMYNLLRI